MLLIRPFLTWKQFFELFRYGISGIIAVAVNLGMFYLLSMRMWYLYASVIAFILSFLTSFTLQKFWTFRNVSLERIHIQSSISFSVACGNLVFNTLSMYVLVGIFGMHYLYAQAMVTLVIAAESFLINKFVVFRH